MFLQILIASLVGSIFALIGGVVLLWKENFARKISLYLVSFAVGSLLGAAFFDLLPEAIEEAENGSIFVVLILGILTVFIFEKFLRWYHCHDREVCDFHTMSSAVLFGDAVHNFIDGIVIAISFSLSVPIGIATTIAVFFHEVPQEIADFGVLLHSGYTKTKVFTYNLLTALTTPVGAILGYFALPFLSSAVPHLAAFAAGTFIYIAMSDLLPEVGHKTRPREFAHVFVIILGLVIIWSVGMIFPE